jgi:hypothetical protein
MKIKKRYKRFHSIPLKHKLSKEQVAKFLVAKTILLEKILFSSLTLLILFIAHLNLWR